MKEMSKLDRTLTVLLRDFGYVVKDNVIIRKGLPNWSSDTVFRNCRSLVDAAEQLCPIINEKEFTDRLIKAMQPSK